MFEEIRGSESWLSVGKIEKGWSSDEKYHVRTQDGRYLQLRISAPERYAELADILPKRSKERIQMQEEMIAQQIRWEEDFAAKFPGVASAGRVIHTSEDTPWDTSIETYARGEISTYSDQTVGLLKKLYDQMAADHENLSEKTLRNMTALYGYESLEEAEKQQRARLER